METAPALLLGLLAVKFTSVAKAITNKDWNAVITQCVQWAAATGATFLLAATEWANQIRAFGNQSLADIATPGKIVVGLMVGSAGSFLYDVKKSIDNTDSAAEPKLLK